MFSGNEHIHRLPVPVQGIISHGWPSSLPYSGRGKDCLQQTSVEVQAASASAIRGSALAVKCTWKCRVSDELAAECFAFAEAMRVLRRKKLIEARTAFVCIPGVLQLCGSHARTAAQEAYRSADCGWRAAGESGGAAGQSKGSCNPGRTGRCVRERGKWCEQG
eukprot:1143693-Pelagomonas_calceolata.AAC.2